MKTGTKKIHFNIEIDKSLNKLDRKVLFPKKLALAKKTLKGVDLSKFEAAPKCGPVFLSWQER